jgi:hypothetical protein
MTSRLNNVAQKVDILEHQSGVRDDFMRCLAYHSIDTEARARRNNLIFYGLADLHNEDTYQLLTDFFEDYLDLDLNEFNVQRVHRLGSLRRARSFTQTTRRPIIAAFLDYRDTEFILSKVGLLKYTNFAIDRDYPKEIAMARKRLWGKFKAEKQKTSDVKIIYPAKLIVNGVTVQDEFPDWYKYMSMDRCGLLKSHQSSAELGISAPNQSVFSVSTEIDEHSVNTGEMQISREDRSTRPPERYESLVTSDGPHTTALPVQVSKSQVDTSYELRVPVPMASVNTGTLQGQTYNIGTNSQAHVNKHTHNCEVFGGDRRLNTSEVIRSSAFINISRSNVTADNKDNSTKPPSVERL